jgi:WD40 repeat protein
MAFSPDGTQVVTASRDGTLRLWSVPGGELLHVLQGHTDAVSYAAYSHSGATIVSAAADDTGRMWSTRTGEQIHVLEGHASALT